MCVIAVVGEAPCQCFSPGGNQTTSPGRISSIGSPQRCTRPEPAVTISVWPSGCVCHAVRAPGSNVTAAPAPARVSGAAVTFEPGARTAWHTHPLGQTLVVTAGFGRVQRWDGPIEEIRPGDVVWFPPGEKHWHGASPTTALTHIAVQEQLDGKNVEWMEQVSDDQYRAEQSAN